MSEAKKSMTRVYECNNFTFFFTSGKPFLYNQHRPFNHAFAATHGRHRFYRLKNCSTTPKLLLTYMCNLGASVYVVLRSTSLHLYSRNDTCNDASIRIGETQNLQSLRASNFPKICRTKSHRFKESSNSLPCLKLFLFFYLLLSLS